MQLRFLLLVALMLGSTGCGSSDSMAPAAGSSPVGGPCTADSSCLTGLTCSTGDPGGQCTRMCAADSDCGAGGSCSADEHKCYHACGGASDCTRAGYGCVGGVTGHMFCDSLPTTPDAGPGGDAGAGFMALPPCTNPTGYTAATAIAFGGTLGNVFSPNCVTVHAGATVTWTGSFVVHPLSAGNGGSAGNPVPATTAGTTVSATFPTAGFYPFYCMRHGSAAGAGMAGVVQVVP